MDWRTLIGFTIIFHAIVYLVRKEWILRFDTRKLNSFFNGIGSHGIRKYLRMWFRLGSYVTIIFGFPFTTWLFLRTLYHCLMPSVITLAETVTPIFTTEGPLDLHQEQLSPLPDADLGAPSNSGAVVADSSYLAIQPVLPGWNLPLSHLPYYLVAILISVVVHESGHAIASASHRIPILGVGFSLFGPLIPAAHVELNSVQLRETKIKRQLDILTAGVWMNLYLALIAYFVMPKLLPVILWPTHSYGTGLSVTGVLANSGAGGPSGLERGDVIIGIENCPVHDLDSWLTCLENIWRTEPGGFCITNDTLTKYYNDSEDCCQPGGDTSPTHLCFLNISGVQHSKENMELADLKPNSEVNRTQDAGHDAFCLPAQPVISGSENKSQNCFPSEYKCSASEDAETLCVLPKIVREYKRFRTVHIYRRQEVPKSPVLFVGDVYDLANGVRVTEYVPRNFFLSKVLGFSKVVMVSVQLETVLLLTAGLSAGLAVVNILPIYGLDGYHVVDALARNFIGKRWDARQVSRLVNWISWAALIIALLTVGCSVVQNI